MIDYMCNIMEGDNNFQMFGRVTYKEEVFGLGVLVTRKCGEKGCFTENHAALNIQQKDFVGEA